MPAPNDWYDIVKDFQTAIGTAVGFTGVCFTLIMSFRLTNQKRNDDLASERAATRTALASELEAVSRSVRRSKQIFDDLKARGLIAFPRTFNPESQSRAYRAILPKIGLLTEVEVEKVVIAYGHYEDLGKMSEETNGEAQDALNNDQKLIAFSAYVKVLAETDSAVTAAIGTIANKRMIERTNTPPSLLVRLKKILSI
jgi:hypothetical protein